jgi:hypothetical protein
MSQTNTSKKSRSKIRSLMGNVVGAGAAVAVVVIALSSSVEAYFRELFVFEDKIIYNIEVVEIYDPEEGEPQNLPIRLVIQDQFGTEFITLLYGQTTGEVSNLKPNNLYEFKIQLKKDVGWITLTSESVSTYPDLAGAVYEVQTNNDYLSNITDLVFSVYVQQGIEKLSEIYLEIIVNGVVYKEELTTGDQKVTIPNFVLTNRSADVTLFAQIENGELVVLHEKEFSFRPYFDSSFSFNYTSIETLEFNATINTRNTRYFLNIFKDGKFVEVKSIETGSLNIQVTPYSNYTFTVVARLSNNVYELLSYQLETQAPPFAITQVYTSDDFKRIQLNLYSLNTEIYHTPYVIIDGILTEFTLVQNLNDTYIYELEIPQSMVSFNIYLKIVDQPNIEYIIDRVGD